MFTTIAASAMFIFTSFVFIWVAVDELRPRTSIDLLLEEIKLRKMGYAPGISWRKMGMLAVVWFGAGYYLWG
jgi:hypothetical protein